MTAELPDRSDTPVSTDAPSHTRPCRQCGEPIAIAASKCKECGSWQNWRRYLAPLNGVLTPLNGVLAAAIALSFFMYPLFRLETIAVDIEAAFLVDEHPQISFVFTNSTNDPVTITGIGLSVDRIDTHAARWSCVHAITVDHQIHKVIQHREMPADFDEEMILHWNDSTLGPKRREFSLQEFRQAVADSRVVLTVNFRTKHGNSESITKTVVDNDVKRPDKIE